MKKFLTLLLVVLIGFTFAGCNDSKSSLAVNIENSVNRLSKLLDTTKEVKNDDILMKQIHSLNGNYNTQTNKTVNIPTEYKKDLRIVTVDKETNEIINDDMTNLGKAIKDMPKGKANTQIVKNESAAKTTKKQELLNNGKYTPEQNYEIKRLTNGHYKPRRISKLNYNNLGLQNYISKIEDLYLMMNDAACANNECNNFKSIIKENCDILDALCGQLKNNQINLNNNQIKACNDLLGNLNKNTNTLNNSKNDVSEHCNAVKKMNINPNANLEQIATKYIKLINCLDEKITCYSNILSILTQLRCTITGLCENENIEAELKENDMTLPEVYEEHIPQTLPYFPPEDLTKEENNSNESENAKIDKDKINQLNENAKIKKSEKENKTLQRNRRIRNQKRPTSRDRDESVTLNDSDNNSTNKTEKIADFDKKITENETEKRKNNLDTFKDDTIKPNVGNENNKTIENTNENPNNSNQNMVNNQNLPNNTNTTNGVNGIMINGVNGTGINTPIVNGAGNNIITNGYGIHNYENGLVNPYRNTDTYKFPTGRRVNNGAYYNNGVYTGIAKFEPLPEETRKNFKTFN